MPLLEGDGPLRRLLRERRWLSSRLELRKKAERETLTPPSQRLEVQELHTELTKKYGKKIADGAVDYALKRAQGLFTSLTKDTDTRRKLLEENLPALLNDARVWAIRYIEKLEK